MATTTLEVLNPPPVIIHPQSPYEHKTTLILLHGTSTSGPVFAREILNHPIRLPPPSKTPNPTSAPQLQTTTLPHLLPETRLVFPSGSPKPLTVLNLPTSNSWFDIHSFSDRTLNEHLAVPGVRESVGYLIGLIKEELRLLEGDGGKRLVLGGFSSGCAMGVMVMLSLLLDGLGEDSEGVGRAIGGFVGMSGWLPFRREIEEAISSPSSSIFEKRAKAGEFIKSLLSPHTSSPQAPSALTNPKPEVTATPLLLLHGTADQKVLPEWCEQMVTVLGKDGLGLDVKMKEYEELGHEFCEREMVDLVGFLKRVWSGLD